jgi:hypothetical protein
MNKEEITISLEEYERLLEDQKILSALYAGGVQDWEWFDASLEDHYE